MEPTPAITATHPVNVCVRELAAALDAVKDVDPLWMTTQDRATALVELAVVEARAASLRMRLLATAAPVAEDAGYRTIADWTVHHTRRDRPACRRDSDLAKALEAWRLVAAGLDAGRVNLDQARVIVTALATLPEGLDPDTLAAAEERLVTDAETFTPQQLRLLARRILTIVAPAVGEAEEQRQVEREEARAREMISFTCRSLGDGTCEVRARISDLLASRLKTYLDAHTAPRHHANARPKTTDTDTTREPGESAQNPDQNAGRNPDALREPLDVRRGKAFTALLENYDPTRLPIHGGATTLMVRIDHDTLTSGVGVGHTLDGTALSVGEARRLACTVGVLPVVLGGDSVVLDKGRTTRLFDRHQRQALLARDPVCQADGCTIPGTWCEAHHKIPWAAGGPTDLANAILLCPWHHQRTHDPTYRVATGPDGQLTYQRRA